MTKVALFYEQAVALRVERHASWCVDMTAGYAFSRAVNAVPLTIAEFRRCARELPVVYSGAGETLFPQAVLGLKERENLHVDARGQWTARYIPAFVRRYPFILSTSPDGQTYTLCVDEGFAGCNEDGRGERLFDDAGEPSAYVKRMLAFLRGYQTEHLRTQAFCARLAALDLLEPAQANVVLKSGERLALTGLQVVSRERLVALPAKEAVTALRDGHLELVFAHLASLDSFGPMVDRLAARAQAGG